jgi:hypothetical protein
VLHVVTELYPTGGHTRLLTRWIEGDGDRRHTVVLTGPEPVPPDAESVFVATGTPIESVFRGDRLSEAGRLLADLAMEHDAVVLHVHPFDVVPLAAFSKATRPPVAAVNHADHTFWLGVRSADVLVNARASGAALAVRRRGVDPRRTTTVPIPLASVTRRSDRAVAKQRLGLPADACVVLTMASGYKYEAPAGEGLVDLVLPVLDSMDSMRDMHLIGIGPVGVAAWERPAATGRVQLVAPTEHADDFLDAADIYLDSYPFCSNTSLLEAAVRGAAVIAYQPSSTRGTVLAADGPALARMLRPADPESLGDALRRLAGAPDERAEYVRALRAEIVEHHTGAGWRESVTLAYKAARIAHRERPGDPGPVSGPDDLDAKLVALGNGAPVSVDGVIGEQVTRWQRGSPMVAPRSHPVPTS